MQGGTNTADALDMVNRNVFQAVNGGRYGKAKIGSYYMLSSLCFTLIQFTHGAERNCLETGEFELICKPYHMTVKNIPRIDIQPFARQKLKLLPLQKVFQKWWRQNGDLQSPDWFKNVNLG